MKPPLEDDAEAVASRAMISVMERRLLERFEAVAAMADEALP